MNIIEARGLIKTYRISDQIVRAVDNVSLLINAGDMVSIMGHSGSGKTTLLNLIGGLTRPDSGDVSIDNSDILKMDDKKISELRNKKIGFIYQFASLIPTLTALENTILPTAFGTATPNSETYAGALLERLGLKDKKNSYPSQLSGGQQRRVAIARAFINRPVIVLADEPTGDLDEDSEKEVIEFFNQMNRELGITLLVVTHNREIAGKMKRQLRMANGAISEK